MAAAKVECRRPPLYTMAAANIQYLPGHSCSTQLLYVMDVTLQKLKYDDIHTKLPLESYQIQI